MPGLLLLGTNQSIQRYQNEEIQQECTQSQQLLCVEQEDLCEKYRDEDGPLEPRICLKRCSWKEEHSDDDHDARHHGGNKQTDLDDVLSELACHQFPPRA
jgi:hypothetical protein